MKICKLCNCQVKLMAYKGPGIKSKIIRFGKDKERFTVAFPLIPIPQRLCYHHLKQAEGHYNFVKSIDKYDPSTTPFLKGR